ncbi:MAG: hypothetical protein ABI114_16400 [Rhodanobacter sp.]
MTYLQAALFLAGVILLIVGYRRNQRKMLLAAAIVLCFSGVGWDVLTGFAHGIAQGLGDWARS